MDLAVAGAWRRTRRDQARRRRHEGRPLQLLAAVVGAEVAGRPGGELDGANRRSRTPPAEAAVRWRPAVSQPGSQPSDVDGGRIRGAALEAESTGESRGQRRGQRGQAAKAVRPRAISGSARRVKWEARRRHRTSAEK